MKLVQLWTTSATALTSLALLTGPALAQAPLVGTTPVNPVPVVTPATGTPVATLTSSFASDPGDVNQISGTVISAVFDNGGTLDFWYQINFTGGTGVSITGANFASFPSFLGVTAEVGQAADGDDAGPVFSSGTDDADEARRAGDGEGVVFSFGLDGDPFSVGESSFSLLIRTNATQRFTGSVGLLASGTAASANILAPSAVGAVAPEPASVGLLALGTLAGGLLLRRRK